MRLRLRVCGRELKHGAANHLAGLQSQRGQARPLKQSDLSFGIRSVENHGGAFQDRPQGRLAAVQPLGTFTQVRLQRLALSDVRQRPRQPNHSAALVPNGGADRVVPASETVRAGAAPQVQRVADALLDGLCQSCFQSRSVLRVIQRDGARQVRLAVRRVQVEQAEQLLRPGDPFGGDLQLPAADFGHALRLSQPRFTRAQGFLSAATFSDVLGGSHDLPGRPVRVALANHFTVPDPTPAAIGVAGPVLNLHDLAVPRIGEGRKMGSNAGQVLRVQHDWEQVRAQRPDLVGGVAQELAYVAVGVNIGLGVQVEHEDDAGRMFRDAFREPPTLAHGLLHRLTLGDVMADADYTDDLARRAVHRRKGQQERHLGAVRANPCDFYRFDRLAPQLA